MLSSLSEREVSTTGVKDQTTFSIKGTGKAFKILIDGLYSDKIGAVVREISTNAFDSHIAAGCRERPFDMHLPTIFEPVFSVRDYGTGMSHDQVMNLYTTVFESSKDKSNDQVGALGLGSKSPFAYTDTFTVTTWDGERCRSYSAFIGEDHVPRIALLADVEDTTSARGVEVSFPVQGHDINTFGAKAEGILQGFDVLPNQLGAPCEVEIPEVVLRGKGWVWVRGTDSAVARQGCVIYPIDGYALRNATQAQRDILEMGLRIDFPIGDLEIAANREALGYDARTSANILKRVDEIFAELVSMLQAQISAAPTLWDAYILFSSLTSFGYATNIRKVIGQSVKWRGQNIYSTQTLAPALDAAGGNVQACYVSYREMFRRRRFKWEPTSSTQITPQEVIVFVDDKAKFTSMVPERIKYYFEQNGINNRATLWVKADASSRAFKRFLVKLGRPPVILVSTLEKPPRDKVTYLRKPVKMRKLAKYSVDEVDVDEEAGGVYFRMDRGEPLKHSGLVTSFDYVRDTVRALVEAGVLQEDDTVYGVPTSLKKVPERNDGWVSIWDLAQAYLNANPVDLDKVGEHRAAKAFLDNDGRIPMWKAAITNGFTVSHEGFAKVEYTLVEQALKTVKETEADATRFNLANRLSSTTLAVPDVAQPQLVKDHIFYKVYPMFKLSINTFNRWSNINRSVAKTVIDYVNLVDKSVSESTVADIAA